MGYTSKIQSLNYEIVLIFSFHANKTNGGMLEFQMFFGVQLMKFVGDGTWLVPKKEIIIFFVHGSDFHFRFCAPKNWPPSYSII